MKRILTLIALATLAGCAHTSAPIFDMKVGDAPVDYYAAVGQHLGVERGDEINIGDPELNSCSVVQGATKVGTFHGWRVRADWNDRPHYVWFHGNKLMGSVALFDRYCPQAFTWNK